MNISIIKSVVDMLKNISELCKKVIEAGDPEKYAHSIQNLNQGVSDTYAEMRNIIINNDDFSPDEKLEKLKQLAESEEESRKKCAEAIKGNRKDIANVSLAVFEGFLTCGLSFAPAIITKIKDALLSGNDVSMIESAETMAEVIAIEQ